MHARRGARGKRQREGGHLRAKERGCEKSPRPPAPGSWTPDFTTVRESASVVQATQCVVFCCGRRGRLTRLPGNALLDLHLFAGFPHFLLRRGTTLLPFWPENTPCLMSVLWNPLRFLEGCVVVGYVGFPGESALEKHIRSVVGGTSPELPLHPIASSAVRVFDSLTELLAGHSLLH